MSKDNGGHAFAHGDPTNGGHPGMSLRDYFAGQAMVARIFAFTNAGDSHPTAELLAELAFKDADAMLAERTKVGAA